MLQFERFGSLIVVAVSEKQSSLVRICAVSERELDVNFSEYVKSQIHLNIVSNFDGPSLSDYIATLKLIESGVELQSDSVTLRRFYWDMAKFLINNPSNIKFNLDVDAPVADTKLVYSLEQVKQQLINLVNGLAGSVDLAKLPYAVIIDEIDSVDDLKNKIDSYAAAAVLLEQLKNKNTRAIQIIR